MDVTVGVFVRGSKGRYQSFVDARVETFNFADLAPTVQSRRDRDKKSATDFTLIICFLMMSAFADGVLQVVCRLAYRRYSATVTFYMGVYVTLYVLHIYAYSCYM